MLNALRHHGGGHRVRPELERAPVQVLNALRHHGGGHEALEVVENAVWRCSTPYGITAEVTAGAVGILIAVVMCSTPYGITAEVTMYASIRPPCV